MESWSKHSVALAGGLLLGCGGEVAFSETSLNEGPSSAVLSTGPASTAPAGTPPGAASTAPAGTPQSGAVTEPVNSEDPPEALPSAHVPSVTEEAEVDPCAPQPTTFLRVWGNLDSMEAIPANPWDPRDPANTSNFSTTRNIYDAKGQEYLLDLYYVKVSEEPSANSWEVHAVVSVWDDTPPYPTLVMSEEAHGTLTFDKIGRLLTATPYSVAARQLGESALHKIELNFGVPMDCGGTGWDGITQTTSAENTDWVESDGKPPGGPGCP